MTAKPLLSDDERVAMLQKYVAEGSEDLDMVSSLVGKVIESGAWSSFKDQLGMPVEHDSFRSFVETPRWRGLGTSKTALVGWVREQDPEAADAVERAWRGEVPAARKHGEIGNGRSRDGVPNSTEANTADYLLARLKRDRPDLAEQVVAGEKSPNAAAIEAGFRPRQIKVTSPESVCQRLASVWTAEQLTHASQLLSQAAQEKR